MRDGRTTTTSEDSATQLLTREALSLAITLTFVDKIKIELCISCVIFTPFPSTYNI